MPSLTKACSEFYFSHSPEQIIMPPIMTTDRAKTLVDHILTNSSHKFSQSGVIYLGLSHHDFTFYTTKTLKQKSRKYNGIFV